MKQAVGIFLLAILFSTGCKQKQTVAIVNGVYSDGADSIAPAGIVKGLSDEQLLETVQKQTFRFFWHGAHPVSGLALERDLSLIHISEPTRQAEISYAVFCL